MKRAAALAAAIVLFASVVALAFGGGLATVGAQSGPSGMVSLGSDQISEDLPDGTDAPLRASDLEGNVYAAEHADTLEVVVTTPELAEEYLDENANVVANDDVAIVLSDDEVHDGRDVAIDTDVLEAGVGYVPSVAYGTHSSGEEWQSAIDRDGATASWHVPEFSSNSVTFSGGIELSGDAAGDGTTYQYQLDSLDGVDNYAINLTGVDSKENSSKSIQSDETSTFEVGGNTEASGEVRITGKEFSRSKESTSSGTNSFSLDGNKDPGGPSGEPRITVDDIDPWDSSTWGGTNGFTWSVSSPGEVNYIEIFAERSDFGETQGYIDVDVYVDGSRVASDLRISAEESETASVSGSVDDEIEVVDVDRWMDHDYDLDADMYGETPSSADVTAGGSTYDVSERGSVDVALLNTETSISTNADHGASVTTTVEYVDKGVTVDPSVSIGGETVAISGEMEDGETHSEPVSLTPGEVNLDPDSSSPYDVELDWTETTETTDPVVEVNGYITEHNGVLSEGETTSLATNDGWLQEGTNNVTVTTSSPATGPESLTGFEYAHDAAGTTRSVDVEATSWTENFNISHTYPSETAGANAVLTFNDRVAEIESLEYRVDGGEWQSPPSYELDGTDLEVGFGDLAADTDIDVRATGYKIRTYDGDVEIVEPTVEGDDLATEVAITNIDEDTMFGLRVDGTALGDRLHYATDESWAGASAHVDITSSGTQILRAPDANEGSTMTVRSSSVSVEPQAGAIEAVVEEGGDEPRFSLRQGNTTGSDAIDITYYDTLSGERYVLWSETRDVEVDANRASSPVHFTTDGDSETYSILQRDAGGGGNPPGPTDARGTLPLLLSFGGIGAVLIGTTLVGRRFGVGGRLLPITAASLSTIALHVLAPGQSPVLRALDLAYQSDIGPIVGVAVLLLGLWQLDQRTQEDVPLVVWLVVGILSGVWALETLSPGVILGGLRDGVSTMAPLLIAGIAIGTGWFVREWLRARREEAQTPDTQVTLGGFEEGGD